jgi:hypothetical protein
MQHTPVLDVRTYRIVPGRREEFDRLFREHSLPLLERHGIRVVAAGPSLVDEDGYTLVRSFDSLEQRREQLDGFYGSAEWLERYDEPVTALIEAYQVVVVAAPAGGA